MLKLWLGLGTKDVWLGLEEDVFLALLIPCHLYTYNIPSLLWEESSFVATNDAGKCLYILLIVSNDFTITNVEAASWTLVCHA